MGSQLVYSYPFSSDIDSRVCEEGSLGIYYTASRELRKKSYNKNVHIGRSLFLDVDP